jgi:type VI protein secretion system component VasF
MSACRRNPNIHCGCDDGRNCQEQLPTEAKASLDGEMILVPLNLLRRMADRLQCMAMEPPDMEEQADAAGLAEEAEDAIEAFIEAQLDAQFASTSPT